MIGRNSVSCRLKYMVRMVFLAQSAIWSSVFSRVEMLKYGKALRKHPVPTDPIFIIGHWRTGSTFLHQLIARDPQLTTPTLFQVAQPESFLTAYHYYKPLFRSVVSKHRPMDMVRLGMNEPQEDEYAIYRMTRGSPLEKLVFPEKDKYFLDGVSSYLPSGKHLAEWERKVVHFHRKIHFHTGKRIVSKNPFNSLRIQTLAKLFPDARFIHIVRNPFDTVPSTIHMWSIVQRQNCLNRNRRRPLAGEVCDVMNFMEEQIGRELNELPSGRCCEVRFEDLEKDPAATLKTLYSCLDLPFTAEFEENIHKFLKEVSGYRKNTFTLSEAERQTIAVKMKDFMSRYRYFSYF
jgi:omega-hydroxy-beta-dihydromenaquinone-9 sulfotransferase